MKKSVLLLFVLLIQINTCPAQFAVNKIYLPDQTSVILDNIFLRSYQDSGEAIFEFLIREHIPDDIFSFRIIGNLNTETVSIASKGSEWIKNESDKENYKFKVVFPVEDMSVFTNEFDLDLNFHYFRPSKEKGTIIQFDQLADMNSDTLHLTDNKRIFITYLNWNDNKSDRIRNYEILRSGIFLDDILNSYLFSYDLKHEEWLSQEDSAKLVKKTKEFLNVLNPPVLTRENEDILILKADYHNDMILFAEIKKKNNKILTINSRSGNSSFVFKIAETLEDEDILNIGINSGSAFENISFTINDLTGKIN